MHRDIRWPNVLKYKDRDAWFLIDFEHAHSSPASKSSAEGLDPATHAPDISNKHTLAVDMWSVGKLIADSGVAITTRELDDIKYKLISGVTERPNVFAALPKIGQIHKLICARKDCLPPY